MISNHDPYIFGTQLGNYILNISHCDGVNSGKRLIHKDKGWVGYQSAGNLQLAPFSTGECIGFLLGKLSQVQFFQGFLQTLLLFLSVYLQGLQDGQNILLNGKLRKYRGGLGQIT